MNTRFKALLKYLSSVLEQEDEKEAILRYFRNEDTSEFTIADEYYYVFEGEEVKELLAEAYKEDCEDFKNTVSAAHFMGNKYIVEYIDFAVVVMDLVDNFDYDDVAGYDFLNQEGDFYIYQDKK